METVGTPRAAEPFVVAAPKVKEESQVAPVRWRLIVILRLPWRESNLCRKIVSFVRRKMLSGCQEFLEQVAESSVEESSKGGGHDTEVEKNDTCAHIEGGLDEVKFVMNLRCDRE